jgi:hypothetical protein
MKMVGWRRWNRISIPKMEMKMEMAVGSEIYSERHGAHG